MGDTAQGLSPPATPVQEGGANGSGMLLTPSTSMAANHAGREPMGTGAANGEAGPRRTAQYTEIEREQVQYLQVQVPPPTRVDIIFCT